MRVSALVVVCALLAACVSDPWSRPRGDAPDPRPSRSSGPYDQRERTVGGLLSLAAVGVAVGVGVAVSGGGGASGGGPGLVYISCSDPVVKDEVPACEGTSRQAQVASAPAEERCRSALTVYRTREASGPTSCASPPTMSLSSSGDAPSSAGWQGFAPLSDTLFLNVGYAMGDTGPEAAPSLETWSSLLWSPDVRPPLLYPSFSVGVRTTPGRTAHELGYFKARLESAPVFLRRGFFLSESVVAPDRAEGVWRTRSATLGLRLPARKDGTGAFGTFGAHYAHDAPAFWGAQAGYGWRPFPGGGVLSFSSELRPDDGVLTTGRFRLSW